jgi:LPPG:FO 2-phospho-L-lactate transferase
MADVVGDDLVVVANTGDDVEIHGAHVSPDPDLVAFWLADLIDERGWWLRDDTWNVMDGLAEIGADPWFRLGDRDLAIGIERRRRLEAGERLTDAHAAVVSALGVACRVLPMTDAPVRTRVRARDTWFAFQEFMVEQRAEGPVQDVEFAGVLDALVTPEVLAAIAHARAIVIGPSNPVISIGPILAVPGIRDALRAARAPVVAVSPIVGGQVVKGPTAAFLAWADTSCDAAGVARMYLGLIDGLVADEEAPGSGVPVHVTDTLMADADGRRRVAEETLRFAEALAS